MYRNILMGIITLALVGLLVLLGYGLTRQGGSARAAGVAVNTIGQAMVVNPRPAVDHTLQLFEGGVVGTSQLRGQVVVVNFWASWCPPCRTEAPALEAVFRKYKDRGVKFLGVNTWDGEKEAKRFLQEFDITYPNGTDKQGKIVVDYGVAGIPETFVVNPEGYIVRRWIGPVTADGLSSMLDDVLSQKSAAGKAG